MRRFENTKKALEEVSRRVINGENVSITGKPRTGKTWAVVHILDNISFSEAGIKIASYLVGAYKHFGYGAYCEEINTENADKVFTKLEKLMDDRIEKIKSMKPIAPAILVLDDLLHHPDDTTRVIKLVNKAEEAQVSFIYSGSRRLPEELAEKFSIKITTTNENEVFYCEEE